MIDRTRTLIGSALTRLGRPGVGVYALVVLVLFGSIGCATTRMERGRVFTTLDGLPNPPVLLVYDFAVSAEDVIVDTFGPALFTGSGEPSERLALGREVQTALTRTLVAKLREKGIHAQRAGRGSRPRLDSLLLKGQFLSIDEGDAMGRTVIPGRGRVAPFEA